MQVEIMDGRECTSEDGNDEIGCREMDLIIENGNGKVWDETGWDGRVRTRIEGKGGGK